MLAGLGTVLLVNWIELSVLKSNEECLTFWEFVLPFGGIRSLWDRTPAWLRAVTNLGLVGMIGLGLLQAAARALYLLICLT